MQPDSFYVQSWLRSKSRLPNYIGYINIIDIIKNISYTHSIEKGEIFMTHDEQVEHAHSIIRSFVQLTLARLAQDWADRGLSLHQIRLLYVLAHSAPATIGQIADHLRIGQSAASLQVDRLVQAHLAERNDDPADRRRALVRLTEAGEALLGRQRVGQQRLHAILNEVDDAHLTMVIDTFTTILSLAESENLFEEGSHD
jgi:DNA-binding MarR family transcriptional regulator